MFGISLPRAFAIFSALDAASTIFTSPEEVHFSGLDC